MVRICAARSAYPRSSQRKAASASEPPDSGRSYEDPPAAMVVCDACGSIIDVVHPLAATAATPRFPPPDPAAPPSPAVDSLGAR